MQVSAANCAARLLGVSYGRTSFLLCDGELCSVPCRHTTAIPLLADIAKRWVHNCVHMRGRELHSRIESGSFGLIFPFFVRMG
jgi:hypothetical protein